MIGVLTLKTDRLSGFDRSGFVICSTFLNHDLFHKESKNYKAAPSGAFPMLVGSGLWGIELA